MEEEQVFSAKLRRIGTSFGVLIPKKLIKGKRFKIGDEIEIILLKKQRIDLIERAFGSARGARPFKRENPDRF